MKRRVAVLGAEPYTLALHPVARRALPAPAMRRVSRRPFAGKRDWRHGGGWSRTDRAADRATLPLLARRWGPQAARWGYRIGAGPTP